MRQRAYLFFLSFPLHFPRKARILWAYHLGFFLFFIIAGLLPAFIDFALTRIDASYKNRQSFIHRSKMHGGAPFGCASRSCVSVEVLAGTL